MYLLPPKKAANLSKLQSQKLCLQNKNPTIKLEQDKTNTSQKDYLPLKKLHKICKHINPLFLNSKKRDFEAAIKT